MTTEPTTRGHGEHQEYAKSILDQMYGTSRGGAAPVGGPRMAPEVWAEEEGNSALLVAVSVHPQKA